MTINRSALRRNTAKALMDKIKNASQSSGEQKSGDDRMWQPTVDSSGLGYAVIRFLPSKTEETLPFVKTYSHGFKEGSKWFIEDCPTSIGQECPVCQANSELWNSGFEDDKKIVRNRKRKLRFISNIMIIKDPKNPENEGKIFLYSYGQKIFDKLTTAMNPPEEYGEEPRDPFGFFDGCVVKIKIKNKDGYRNYDDTTVDPASDLYEGDEEKLMEVLDSMHDIQEFLDPKRFKSFEDIKKRLNMVLGLAAASAPVDETKPSRETNPKDTGKEMGRKVEEKEEVETPQKTDSSQEDDDLAFFKQLAEE